MSPRKLTAADKKAIVSTYRSSPESTTVLADRYGVSSSTISRLLKNNILEDEYESLINGKRTQKGESEEDILLGDRSSSEPIDFFTDNEAGADEETVEDLPLGIPRLRATPTGNRRVRRRSSASEEQESFEQNDKPTAPKPITRAQKYSLDTPVLEEDNEQEYAVEAPPIASRASRLISPVTPAVIVQPVTPKLSLPMLPTAVSSSAVNDPRPARVALEINEDVEDDLSVVAGIFGEDMSDLLDEEEDDLPEEEGWSDSVIPTLVVPEMQVLPLASATLPRTCYIVVDKFAELVACPLRDFVDVGKTSSEDTPQNTLPVFDNQRVAKRFSNNRNQRVIKVPDSGVFYKTIDHLLAKGISLMLVDGRIYSLR
jgi:hypothetical protein